MDEPPNQYSRRLLVCEGKADCQFFLRLIEANALERFYIVDANGKGNFEDVIRNFKVQNTEIFSALQSIVIVGDNDENPQSRFDDICEAVRRLFGDRAVPDRPTQTIPQNGTNPAIAILMVPSTGANGHLERLCFESAKSTGIRVREIDGFLNGIGAGDWSESRYFKAWIRIYLAVRCAHNPTVSMHKVFKENRNRGLIPIDHRSFRPIVELLRGLP